MVLIILLRSERRWVVNEKYTDSDLCKVSLQMAVRVQSTLETGGRGPRCSGHSERTQCFIRPHPRVVLSDGR